MPGRNRSGGNASIGELFGRKGADLSGQGATPNLDMNDMKELLGDNMPKISYTQAGRLRLVRALQQRFGDSFTKINGISEFLKEFDDEMKHKLTVARIKIARNERINGR